MQSAASTPRPFTGPEIPAPPPPDAEPVDAGAGVPAGSVGRDPELDREWQELRNMTSWNRPSGVSGQAAEFVDIDAEEVIRRRLARREEREMDEQQSHTGLSDTPDSPSNLFGPRPDDLDTDEDFALWRQTGEDFLADAPLDPERFGEAAPSTDEAEE